MVGAFIFVKVKLDQPIRNLAASYEEEICTQIWLNEDSKLRCLGIFGSSFMMSIYMLLDSIEAVAKSDVDYQDILSSLLCVFPFHL